MPNPLVVALIYDQLCTFEFGCVVEVFGLDRSELGVPWYRFATVALEGRSVSAAGGVTITPSRTGFSLADADTIIVPGWRGPDAEVPQVLIDELRAAHKRGARLCSICGGSFVLAAAGLLDGRRVTTHWRFMEALAARYPQLTLEPDDLYVDTGDIVTAAGSASGLDMMLHLVRKDHGAHIANQVAQRMVVSPHREGGQLQYAQRKLVAARPSPAVRVMEWMRADLARPYRIQDMADHVAVSPRTLHRGFIESIGVTPYEWLLGERITRARELLESTSQPLAQVAERCGFASEESFRRHFRHQVGISPGRYRRQFTAIAQA